MKDITVTLKVQVLCWDTDDDINDLPDEVEVTTILHDYHFEKDGKSILSSVLASACSYDIMDMYGYSPSIIGDIKVVDGDINIIDDAE